MATCIESPQPLVASGHSAQPELYRLVLPMLYAIMGISVGTLVGASLALTSGPAGNSMVYYHATPASSSSSSTVAQAATIPIMSSAPIQTMVSSAPAPIQNALSAIFVRTADPVSRSFTFGHSAANPARSGILHAHHGARVRHTPASSRFAPGKAPAAERLPQLPLMREDHPSKPSAHPVTKPLRKVLASAPIVSPQPLAAQPNMDSAALSSAFYTEGDLTVAAYDAASGTIQSSDGRTFLIGSTVSLSTATPWSDYQGDVHYRCAANGSCTLVRPGVLASNARLI